MGNVDTRCHHEHGYLIVQTAQPFYYPGTPVTGTIYLRVTHPVEAKFIELQISGKEKVSFLTHETRDNQQHHIKRKARREIIHYSQPAFHFTTPVLAPGDYVIPFSFPLPVGIPSSVFYYDNHHADKPKAKVKYHIKAKLHNHHGKAEMSYKQILVVREAGAAAQQVISQTSENRITTWCC
jgi:hypothetical protein